MIRVLHILVILLAFTASVNAADSESEPNTKGKNATQEKVKDLTSMLKDENKQVREKAARSLGGFGPAAKEAVPALIESLKDKGIASFGGPNQGFAAVALGQIGQDAVPALVEALKDKDKSVSRLAAYALGQIGQEAKAVVPSLEELLKKEKVEYVRRAAAAL